MTLLDVLALALIAIFVGVALVLAADLFGTGRRRADSETSAARAHAEKQVLALLTVVDHCRQSMLDDREQFFAALSQVLDGAREEREVLYRTVLANTNPVALRALDTAPTSNGKRRPPPVMPPPEPYVDEFGEPQVPVGFDAT